MQQLRHYFDTEDEVLHACIRDGDLPRLQQKLGVSPALNINYSHPGFGSPIHFAAWCGNLDAVELLLAAGADPLLVSHGDRRLTAIGYAALKGHRDIVKRLWAFCPPEGHVRGHGPRTYQTCLVVAATHGRVAVVEDLLDWWDSWPQDLKIEALLWAARRWHFGVATLLLDRISFEQSTLQEALRLATEHKFMLGDEFRVKCEGIDYLHQQLLIALFIDAGADPNSCPDDTPLLYSVACDANLTGALKALLEKGADPNKTNRLGQSALHVVAEPVGMAPSQLRLNEGAIRLLLKHKSSVSQPDNAGECPLHWAAYGLDLRLFRLYLSCPDQGEGALLQLANYNGETLLHFAAAGCCIDTMEFLIARGLDVNAKNSNGWTPLMCALFPIKRDMRIEVKSLTKAMQAAQWLVSHGADASITTNEGLTLLHGLALYRNDDVSGRAADFTKNLISRGVNPEARAPLLSPDPKQVIPSAGLPWGYRFRDTIADPSTQRMVVRPDLTPIYWAAERGALGVIKALLAHGVNVSSTDVVDGMSPARMAAESKFLEGKLELVDTIIELLLAAGSGF